MRVISFMITSETNWSRIPSLQRQWSARLVCCSCWCRENSTGPFAAWRHFRLASPHSHVLCGVPAWASCRNTGHTNCRRAFDLKMNMSAVVIQLIQKWHSNFIRVGFRHMKIKTIHIILSTNYCTNLGMNRDIYLEARCKDVLHQRSLPDWGFLIISIVIIVLHNI